MGSMDWLNWIIFLSILIPILLGLLSATSSGSLANVTSTKDLQADHPRYVSDEEFVAASGDVNQEVALRVRAVISQQLGIAEHSIHPDDNFVRDLGCE